MKKRQPVREQSLLIQFRVETPVLFPQVCEFLNRDPRANALQRTNLVFPKDTTVGVIRIRYSQDRQVCRLNYKQAAVGSCTSASGLAMGIVVPPQTSRRALQTKATLIRHTAAAFHWQT